MTKFGWLRDMLEIWSEEHTDDMTSYIHDEWKGGVYSFKDFIKKKLTDIEEDKGDARYLAGLVLLDGLEGYETMRKKR